MLIFATTDDLSLWNTGVDWSCAGDLSALLRSASLMVAKAAAGACYDVDDTGLPTDTGLLQALNDATCAQVTAWVVGNVDPAGAGITAGVKSSVAIGSASITYADAQSAATSRAASLTSLVEEAYDILRTAGLASTRVWSYG